MRLKRLEIADSEGKLTSFIELRLENEKLSVNINGKSATTTDIERFLALLEGAFLELIDDDEVIETKEGYIVFFKGKDRYGIRVRTRGEREVIFLRKLAYRELYHWLCLQLVAS